MVKNVVSAVFTVVVLVAIAVGGYYIVPVVARDSFGHEGTIEAYAFATFGYLAFVAAFGIIGGFIVACIYQVAKPVAEWLV